MELSLNRMAALKIIGPILFFTLLFGFKGYAQSSTGTNNQQNKVTNAAHKDNIDRSEKIQVSKESVQRVNDSFKPGSMQNSVGHDTTINKTVVPKVEMKENLFEGIPNKEIPLKK